MNHELGIEGLPLLKLSKFVYILVTFSDFSLQAEFLKDYVGDFFPPISVIHCVGGSF